MKNLKNIFATAVLTVALLLGTTASNAGVVISGLQEDCNTPQTKKGILVQDLGGVVISGLIGVVISGLTGVVISGVAETPTNCGVVISG